MLRDDAFDCVTYCETVLAAARARDHRRIRERACGRSAIATAIVNWFERNHYFFEWCQHNVENKTCRWLDMDGAVDIEKTVDSQKGLSKRRFAMRVIPRAVFLANKAQAGNRRYRRLRQPAAEPGLFPQRLCRLRADGTLLLRHASESRRRVLDERMDRFLAR